MRHRVEHYLEQRAQEVDAAEPSVHGLTATRAVEEWKRLEPAAIGHERPLLHDFFGRTRNSFALPDQQSGGARALCWVSADGDIGPAVAESPEDLVPVVLAALDHVAKTQEPETFGVFCTTDSWWLLDRLRRLGFRVHWPAWVMSSVPLPGLDRSATCPPRRRGCSDLATTGWHGRGPLPTSPRKTLAVAVLVVAAYVLFKIVLGAVLGIAWVVLAVLAVVAVIWALRVL